MANTYDLGDVVRLTGTWTDPLNSDAALDPTAVNLSIRNPAGTVTTYVYGDDAELVKSSTGVYYLDLDLDTAGIWHYRFFSTGTGKAAEEEYLTVIAPQAV